MEPNTGQPIRMTATSMTPVMTPTDKWGRRVLMLTVKKSVPPLDDPRMYKSAMATPHKMPVNRAASSGSPP